MKLLIIIIFLLAAPLGLSFGETAEKSQPLTIQIVYDNNEFDPDLTPEWGFSCFIKGKEKTLLFDTGGNGKILLSNMEKLKVKPEEVEASSKKKAIMRSDNRFLRRSIEKLLNFKGRGSWSGVSGYKKGQRLEAS